MTTQPGSPSPEERVTDFLYGGKRIIAFAADDGAPSVEWPGRAERYAAAAGVDLAEPSWYEVRPKRFANGRPHVSKYLMDARSWKFETDMKLAREIVQKLGFDPDNLPLDL